MRTFHGRYCIMMSVIKDASPDLRSWLVAQSSFRAISSLLPLPTAPIPIAVALVFLPLAPEANFESDFHPIQLTTFLAKISPNPSMTPFTKGRRKLIARALVRARRRVRVESVESKIVRVADGGCGRSFLSAFSESLEC